MKSGDLVRFRQEKWARKNPSDCGIWVWRIGLLVEYHAWEKVATILYKGQLIRVHADSVTKAGRKDREMLYESRRSDKKIE